MNAQTGFGIAGIDLDAFDAQGHAVIITGDTTGADGTYTLNLPAAGNYYVRADPSLNDFFVDQYYSNVFLRGQATLINVGASEVVSGIDFRLRSGFQIQGFIRSQGVPIADVDLDLYASTGEFLSGYPARSAADGSFTLGVLPPGSYFLFAQPTVALGQFFVPAFYGGAPTLSQATPIVVTNRDVTGLILDLAPGGAISGAVVDQVTGSPLAGFDLDLYDTNHVFQPFNAVTDASGSYVMGPIPAGHYQLRVDPTVQQGYAQTYFSNTFFHATAQTIDVQAGRITPAIDFALVRAGAIDGRILSAATGQPISAVDVHVYDLATNSLGVFAKSDTNGHYLLGPLPAGSYYVRTMPDKTLGYARQYYDRATNISGAKAVPITAGVTTSNINFHLDPAGWLEGTVSNVSGTRLVGIDLDIYEATTGTRLVLGALTSTNGTYEIGPIPPGEYKLRCDPAVSQGYAVEYYNGKLTKALADVVVVKAAVGTSNINFTLDPGGSLSGRVVAAGTGLPLAGVDLDVFQAETLLWMDQTGQTDLEGRFTVGPLPSGTYLVRADPALTNSYVRTYYSNTVDAASAQPIALTAPGAITNLEIRLTVTQTLPPPALAISSAAPTLFRIWLSESPGRVFQLERRTNLTEGAWIADGLSLTNTTGTVSWERPAGTSPGFYRVSAP